VLGIGKNCHSYRRESTTIPVNCVIKFVAVIIVDSLNNFIQNVTPA
jgi:hypothetical protein